MKPKILMILAAAAVFGAAIASGDSQFEYVELDVGEEALMRCSMTRLCTMELEAGEKVFTDLIPNFSQWETQLKRKGPNGDTPVFAIRPKACGISTSVEVLTDRRTYRAVAYAPDCDLDDLDPVVRSTVVKWKYPARGSMATDHQQPVCPAPPPPRVCPSVKPARCVPCTEEILGVMPEDVYTAYRFSARKARALGLETVFDDGDRMFLRVKRTVGAKPVVYQLVDGKKRVINAEWDGDLLITDRVAPCIVLVRGGSQVKIRRRP